MEYFNFLRKKSLLFFLIALLGSQNLCAMDEGDNVETTTENSTDTPTTNVESSSSNDNYPVPNTLGSWFKPAAYWRCWLKTGEYAPGYKIPKKSSGNGSETRDVILLQGTITKLKDNYKTDIETLNRIHQSEQSDRGLVIDELKRENFNLKGLKTPGFFDNLYTHKWKTIGGAVVIVGATGILSIYLYKKYQKWQEENEEKAKRDIFLEVDKGVVRIYQALGDGIKQIEELLIKSCEDQKKEFISELQNLEQLLENSKNEEWVKNNKKWAKNVIDGYEKLHDRIRESVLDKTKVQKICEIIEKQLKQVELLQQKKKNVVIFDKTAIQYIKDTKEYDSDLDDLLGSLKKSHEKLFGGDDKSEKPKLCRYQLKPINWYNEVYKEQGKLYKRFGNRKTISVKPLIKKKNILKKTGEKFKKAFTKKPPSFLIEEKFVNKVFDNFVNEKGKKKYFEKVTKDWRDSLTLFGKFRSGQLFK